MSLKVFLLNLTKKQTNSPPFGPSVLEPCFDLSIRHLQTLGERRPFRTRQVLLLVKPLLQLSYLEARERGAGLFPLRGRPVLVGVPDTARDGECCEQRRERD